METLRRQVHDQLALLCSQGNGQYEIVDDFLIDEWLDEKIMVGCAMQRLSSSVCETLSIVARIGMPCFHAEVSMRKFTCLGRT